MRSPVLCSATTRTLKKKCLHDEVASESHYIYSRRAFSTIFDSEGYILAFI